MNTSITSTVVMLSLFGAVALGIISRRLLPEHHRSADTKDTVKLSMGLVATMTALLLGLLVASAKGSYDAARGNVSQMVAKVAFLDRVLNAYGPETREIRAQMRAMVQDAAERMWPGDAHSPSQLAPNTQGGDAVFLALQRLTPQDDTQRNLKTIASTLFVELAQLRSLLYVQTVPSISRPMLVIVILWLVLIFFSFAVLAPSNSTATLALLVSAASVCGALFLILELDRPFAGLLQIPSAPLRSALASLGE